MSQLVRPMRLEDLSHDIWDRIVTKGQLDINDVIHLTTCSPKLKELFNDFGWYKLLVDNYLDILISYRVESAFKLRKECQSNKSKAYEVLMKFYTKEMKFNTFCEPGKEFRDYADLFVGDDDYIPIIYRRYYQLPGITIDKKKDVELESRSIYCLLLQAQCCKLGAHYLRKARSVERYFSTDAQAIENVLFHINLLDRDSFRFVHTYHSWIESFRSHKELECSHLFTQAGVDLPENRDPSSKLKVLIESERLDVIVSQAIRIISQEISKVRLFLPPTETNETTSFDFSEDLNLLRVATGCSSGSLVIVLIIINKILDDILFSKCEFIVIGKSEGPIVPILNHHILEINGCYYTCNKYETPGSGQGVGSFIETRIERTEPIQFDSFIMNVRNAMQIAMKAEPKSIYIHGNMDRLVFNGNLDPTTLAYIPIGYSDITWVKEITRLFSDGVPVGDDADVTEHIRKIAIVTCIARLSIIDHNVLLNMAQIYFTPEGYPTLPIDQMLGLDPKDSYKEQLLLGLSEEDESTNQFKKRCGTIVITRRGDFGIILVESPLSNETDASCVVYTTKRTFDRCLDANLKEVNYQHPNFSGIVTLIITACGEDILGYVFTHLDLQCQPPRFIMKPGLKKYLAGS